jgi:hypothetical protein
MKYRPQNSKKLTDMPKFYYSYGYFCLEYVSALTASVFVRAILAVGGIVTEKLLVDALAVSAAEFSLGTEGLVCLQERLHLAGLCVWEFLCKIVFHVREMERRVRRKDQRDRLRRISVVLVIFVFIFDTLTQTVLEEFIF